MDCRITFTKARRCSGLTLLELMVAGAVSSVLAVGLAALMFYSARSFAAMLNYIILDNQSRLALDDISREIRQANRLVEHAANAITLEQADGTTLSYEWSADDKTLTRTDDGLSKVLLEDCADLNFSIYQRNPIGGTYDQYPTATPATCKLVQIHWICSRKVLGAIVNTESIQSAKVVIRKQ